MDDDVFPGGLSLDDQPSAAEQDAVTDRINTFNINLLDRDDYRPLNYVLRDAEGVIVAGVLGFTWAGGCEIKILWVDEAWRGQGLGSRLLRMAEREAAARGVRVIVLDTFDFQAARFYPRYGYELVGTVDDYPEGHRRFYYQKRLSPGTAGNST